VPRGVLRGWTHAASRCYAITPDVAASRDQVFLRRVRPDSLPSLSTSFVSIAEAAYRLDLDDQTWLEGMLAAAAPALDDGDGVGAAIIDSAGAVPAPSLVLAVAVRGPARVLEAFVQANSVPSTTEMRERLIGLGPVSSARLVVGPTFDQEGGHGSVLREHGYEDSVVIFAGDPTGISCVIASPRKSRATLSPRFKSTWGRAAAHIASGHRLRRHLRDGSLAATEDAVLDPAGRVQHAAADATASGAREALRHAVLASEEARGPMRSKSPDQALALWGALVSGRWSLIDRFDSDGRRFLVARRNEALSAPRAPLSERECQVAALVSLGHSNKLISYELGLAASTVATHLASAMTKLGVPSRVELVQLFGRGG
jgi:DNA-binding CsgD family transcriptional regulator